jgi:hypothetical protein
MLPVILVAVGAYLIGDSVLGDKKYAKGGSVLISKEEKAARRRLEELRKELRAERISYSELAELEALKEYIDNDDIELLQAAGVEQDGYDDDYDDDKYAKGGQLDAKSAEKRLEELRKVLRAESISYGELAELESLKKYIDDDDVELRQAAGIPEFDDDDDDDDDKYAKGGKVGMYQLMPYVSMGQMRSGSMSNLSSPSFKETITFEGTKEEAINKANSMVDNSEEITSVEVSSINPKATNVLKMTKKIEMVRGNKMAKGGATKKDFEYEVGDFFDVEDPNSMDFMRIDKINKSKNKIDYTKVNEKNNTITKHSISIDDFQKKLDSEVWGFAMKGKQEGYMAKGGKTKPKKLADNSRLVRYAQTDEQLQVLQDIIPIFDEKGIELSFGTSVGKSPQAIIFDKDYQDGILYIGRDGWDGECTYDGEDFGNESKLQYIIENPEDYMAKGGATKKASELEYDSILSVLKEKIEDSIGDLPKDYEMAAETFEGEEVEHQSRDGFIAYTDGGYEARWFDNINNLNGSGISLPTAGLDAEMQRQVDYNYESAKERFTEEYPEIVEELGEGNIEYNALQDAGYESEAEQLSEWEMDYDGDNTIMMEIGAFYYTPENSRGKDGKHTMFVFANVNLESPYHRHGNLEDGTDSTFTFNSLDDLNKKMDASLNKIIEWFDGKHYKEGKKDLRVTRMAKGGETTKEYLFNFTDGGWNSVIAKDKREAIKLAKQQYKNLKVDEKSFRLKTEKDYKQLMSSFYAKGGDVQGKTTSKHQDEQRFAKPTGVRWKDKAVKRGVASNSDLAKSPSKKMQEKYPKLVYTEKRSDKSDVNPSVKYKSI